MGDFLTLLVLSLLAMANPSLLAAVTVMLLLPQPRRLMLGYLAGALLTSVAVGLVVVFTLHGSASVETTKRTLSPGADLAIGVLLVLAASVLRSGRAEARQERRRARKAAVAHRPSLPERLLGRGSARVAFFLGVVLSFPGASYLAALDRTAKLDLGAAGATLVVVGFSLVQLLFLEAPLLGFAVAPERTAAAVASFRAWLERSGRRAAANVALALGAALLVRGAVGLAVG